MAMFASSRRSASRATVAVSHHHRPAVPVAFAAEEQRPLARRAIIHRWNAIESRRLGLAVELVYVLVVEVLGEGVQRPVDQLQVSVDLLLVSLTFFAFVFYPPGGPLLELFWMQLRGIVHTLEVQDLHPPAAAVDGDGVVVPVALDRQLTIGAVHLVNSL